LIDKTKILSYGDMLDVYHNYCANLHTNIINLGYPLLESKIRNLRKQELITVLAQPGVGKSILTLNFVLNYLEKSEEIALVFSLEMSAFSILERTVQRKFLMAGEDVEKAFVSKDASTLGVIEKGHALLENFKVVPHRIDVKDIPEYVAYTARVYKKSVGLIVCDHVGLLQNSDYKQNAYARTTDNMQKLYNYSKDLNVGVINVSQIGREDSRKGKIDIFSGKESGEVENSSDYVISFEPVPKDTTFTDEVLMLSAIRASGKPFLLMKINFLKTRRGGADKSPVYALFDTRTIVISEYDSMLLI